MPGALYGVCPEGCIYYFGLAWWAVVLQFIILVVTIPVGVRSQCPSTSCGLPAVPSTWVPTLGLVLL